MIDVDIEEIITAMLEKGGNVTYYLNKNTLNIVHVDENIAQEVEDEYEAADTAIEEWGVDHEDDDMYHEKIYNPTDEVDEKELIKQIRYTNQDDYEPIPTITLSETKKILDNFLARIDTTEVVMEEFHYELESIKTMHDIDPIVKKVFGEKEKWQDFFHDKLREKVNVWLSSIGLSISDA